MSLTQARIDQFRDIGFLNVGRVYADDEETSQGGQRRETG